MIEFRVNQSEGCVQPQLHVVQSYGVCSMEQLGHPVGLRACYKLEEPIDREKLARILVNYFGRPNDVSMFVPHSLYPAF